MEEEREYIRKSVEATVKTTGERPLGYHATTSSGYTRELLVEEGGFVYDTDSYADDLPYFVEVHGKKWLVVPYDVTTNDSCSSHTFPVTHNPRTSTFSSKRPSIACTRKGPPTRR